MNVTLQKSFSLSKISTSLKLAGSLLLAKTFMTAVMQRVFLFSKNSYFKIARAAVFFTLFVSAFSPAAALAQEVTPTATTSPLGEGLAIIQEPLGLPVTDIRVIIANIIRVGLGLIGIILVVLLLYAGFLWLTAGGNEEQITTAKAIIKNAVIGLAIILSAYAIVAFILKMLGVGGNGLGGGDLNPPGSQNFTGSGALGSIIKDHYPERDQKEVARNTKIIITFRKPIKPDSVINDANLTANNQNNPNPYGDCINVGPQMKWETDCDTIKLDADHINITSAVDDKPIRGANVVAYYENGKVFTLIIRPFDNLGSSNQEISYKVRVGNKILLDDQPNANPPIFNVNVVGNKFYEWQFTCSTALDTTPPHVTDVFPGPNTKEPKNSVIQINFSEAMDPSGMQGQFQAANGYFALSGNTVFLQSGNSSLPAGNFSLVNGYRTLEFTPATQCATNACGQQIFCMPVCDSPGAQCATDVDGVNFDTYKAMVRAASTFSVTSFEAIPFSGAVDVSGNALDGNDNSKVESVDKLLPVFAVQGNPQSQEKPDNYSWSFGLRDALDITPPYLRQITPGLDAQFISANSNWQMQFSKRMRIEPFYTGVQIAEKPSPAQRGDNIPICLVPRVSFLPNNYTSTTMQHCAFRDTKRQYYFPVVNSDVEDAHFNCFYPGKGPGGAQEVQGHNVLSNICDDGNNSNNCCKVDPADPNKAICCNGGTGINNVKDPATCTTYLINNSP